MLGTPKNPNKNFEIHMSQLIFGFINHIYHKNGMRDSSESGDCLEL